MPVDKSIIGTELGTVTFPIEAGKVQEFAKSLHFDNPIYYDLEAARAAGFENIPAPPTYTVVSAHFTDPKEQASLMGSLKLDLSRVLHGGQSWTYHRTPLVGDVLTGYNRVADVYEKPGRKGGTMTFIILETVYKDQSGNPVVTVENTIIETARTVGSGGGDKQKAKES